MNSEHPSPNGAPVNGDDLELPWDDEREPEEDDPPVRGQVAFAIVPEWLILSDLSLHAKHMYAVLALHINRRSRECWPSLARMAALAQMSVRTVQRALRDLEAFGALTRKARFRIDRMTGQPCQTTSLYTLCQVPMGTGGGGTTAPPLVTGQSPAKCPASQGKNQNHRNQSLTSVRVAGATDDISETPKSKPESPNQRLVRLFSEGFERTLGTPYEPERKDFVIAAKLLARASFDEVENRCVLALEKATTDPWWHEHVNLGLVSSQWRALGLRDRSESGERR